jgi:hypothetical protein
VAQEDDAAGLQAGRAYDKGIRDFEKPGRVERAAKEAQQALEGPEGRSSSGHRKPRDARAKAMMLAVDARRSSDLAEDIRSTALRPSQPDSNVVTSLGSN